MSQVPRIVIGGWYIVIGKYYANVMKKQKRGNTEKDGRGQRKGGCDDDSHGAYGG